MLTNAVSIVSAPPERLPGLGLMGFICCKCSEATLDKKLGRCFDAKCGHQRCLSSCVIFDEAGRMWKKQFAIPISWICVCGRSHSVVGSLIGRSTRPVCCSTPAFLALYSTTGRLCKGLKLSCPFTLGTAVDITRLVLYLRRTPWGSCIDLELGEIE